MIKLPTKITERVDFDVERLTVKGDLGSGGESCVASVEPWPVEEPVGDPGEALV